MDKFISLQGIAAPLPIVNIDTDMIIPKQFLKTIKRTGLGVSLFYEMRYDNDGKLINDFVLNTSPYGKIWPRIKHMLIAKKGTKNIKILINLTLLILSIKRNLLFFFIFFSCSSFFRAHFSAPSMFFWVSHNLL